MRGFLPAPSKWDVNAGLPVSRPTSIAAQSPVQRAFDGLQISHLSTGGDGRQRHFNGETLRFSVRWEEAMTLPEFLPTSGMMKPGFLRIRVSNGSRHVATFTGIAKRSCANVLPSIDVSRNTDPRTTPRNPSTFHLRILSSTRIS